ncbi:ATP-binding protein [Streptomyces sp. NPDC057636]|uniref:ATP-binding protein n=1 Tax=Streptomyces sp. NPDC057636 TaxID=3346189 RepID=UPI0036A84C6B
MSTDTTTKTKEQGAAQVPTSGPAWDWAAGHGPVTGALSSTTGALALATTGAATGMPPGWALAVGTAGAIGHTVAGYRWRNAGRTIATRAASWLVGAGWTTWAISSGPLSWAAIGSLAAIGVGIGTTARSMGLYEEAREEEALASERRAVLMELSAERRKIAAEWTDRIQRVCGITVRVKGVEMWKTGTGFSIDAYLPEGGATWERIASEAPRLSADARLPHGCTATAGPGVDQGRVILDVTTVNVLIETRNYPDDYAPVSIYTGIPWGYRTNAEEICVYLREQCALVVGPTGSGKTNMVHVILAGFARATDVLTFVIDLNAGSAGLSWVLPALNHQPAGGEQAMRPGIDWLASTPEEANLMLDAVLRIGLQRKVSYQGLMAKQNTDQLPISAKIPQIMLVIDEGAEILTSTDRTLKELAKKILEVIRMLRAMGIRTVLTALGATGSVLGNLMIRREAKARVVLTGGEVEGMDLSKVFPGARGLKVTQAPYKGAGFMGTPESSAALFKNWRILPNQIRDIVAATSDRHPVLDSVSVKAAGPVYTTRWDADRIAWMNSATPAPSPAPVEREPAEGLNLSALHKPDVESEEDLAEKFRQEIDARFATAPEPGSEQPPASKGLNLSALHNENGTGEQGRESGPDWLAAAIDAIAAAGASGLKPSTVADLVCKDRKTVRAGLQGAVDRGALVYRDNGPHSVYVHPDHA